MRVGELAIGLTKLIAPEYPLRHEEILQIIVPYLVECYCLSTSYDMGEIDKRIWSYYSLSK